MYTFFSHLRWTPVIALGYAASILVHFWVDSGQFSIPSAQQIQEKHPEASARYLT